MLTNPYSCAPAERGRRAPWLRVAAAGLVAAGSSALLAGTASAEEPVLDPTDTRVFAEERAQLERELSAPRGFDDGDRGGQVIEPDRDRLAEVAALLEQVGPQPEPIAVEAPDWTDPPAVAEDLEPFELELYQPVEDPAAEGQLAEVAALVEQLRLQLADTGVPEGPIEVPGPDGRSSVWVP